MAKRLTDEALAAIRAYFAEYRTMLSSEKRFMVTTEMVGNCERLLSEVAALKEEVAALRDAEKGGAK